MNYKPLKNLGIRVGESSEEKKNSVREIHSPYSAQNLKFELVFQIGGPAEVMLHALIKKRIDLLIFSRGRIAGTKEIKGNLILENALER